MKRARSSDQVNNICWGSARRRDPEKSSFVWFTATIFSAVVNPKTIASGPGAPDSIVTDQWSQSMKPPAPPAPAHPRPVTCGPSHAVLVTPSAQPAAHAGPQEGEEGSSRAKDATLGPFRKQVCVNRMQSALVTGRARAASCCGLPHWPGGPATSAVAGSLGLVAALDSRPFPSVASLRHNPALNFWGVVVHRRLMHRRQAGTPRALCRLPLTRGWGV